MRSQPGETKKIRSYCVQCGCLCPTAYTVVDGIFVKAEPDRKNPDWVPLCPKGAAGPELVYDPQRLKYPLRRTNSKDNPDPGWQRISWDEALNLSARRLIEIKSRYGAQAIVFGRTSPGGSPGSDLRAWVVRLANVLGTPNVIAHTHVCQWHRDQCSNYTYGHGGIGTPDFENAACILVWGSNLHASGPKRFVAIKKAQQRGAKLIVVDPRRTPVAARAALWLCVKPGTDGALILSLINIMLREGLYDKEFTRDWTNAPFLVRRDSGDLLREKDIDPAGQKSRYIVWDVRGNGPAVYDPESVSFSSSMIEPALFGSYAVKLTNGQEVMVDTVLQLLLNLVSQYPTEKTEAITGVPKDKIEEAARMIGTLKPLSYYTFTGIEEHTNAAQTNRALCILYSLTGNYDTRGGNILLPSLPVNGVSEMGLLPQEMQRRRLSREERPLGPAGRGGSIPAYAFFKAVLEGKPYPVKAFVTFGGDVVMADSHSLTAKKALQKLEFYLNVGLYLTPAAQYADIVLPAASFYECGFVRAGFPESLKNWDLFQWRAPAVSPQYESRSDLDIIFDLARRLEIGDKFWEGNTEAAFNYFLAPSGITVEQLKNQPGGISMKLPLPTRKYSAIDAVTGKPRGFETPSRRIEIFSQVFKDAGYDPLPVYKEPRWTADMAAHLDREYPLILTNARVLQFCHGQHRSLPSLRKAVPHPFLEIHPDTARFLSIRSGDDVGLETPEGSITLKAKVTDVVPPGVVCTQVGWWQSCPELGLPGYDPYSSEGANLNLLYDIEPADPVSGSLPYRSYRCRVRKITR
jgi:anaerobic selenocysteine-containing dehydrogenase